MGNGGRWHRIDARGRQDQPPACLRCRIGGPDGPVGTSPWGYPDGGRAARGAYSCARTHRGAGRGLGARALRKAWVVTGLTFLGLLAGCAAVAPTQSAPGLGSAAPSSTASTGVTRTLRIGYTASKTGAQQVASSKQVQGIELWAADVQRAGGIRLADGTVLMPELVSYDDESKTDRVQALYTRLANEDGVDVLISPYSSGLVKAAAVISEQTGKVMVTAGGADDATMEQGFKGVYQVYTPASKYLTGAIDLMLATYPSIRKIAIVNEKDAFSTAVAAAAKPYAESRGLQVVLDEGYDSGTTDFAPLIDKIIAAGPEAVVGGGHFQDGQTLAKQLYEKQVTARFVALLVAPPEPTFAEIGEAAVGIVGPSQWEPSVVYSPATAAILGIPFTGPDGATFSGGYSSAYGATPSYHAAGGYAAGLTIQLAVETAGSTDPGALRAALDATDVETFFGRIKFSSDAATHGKQIGHQMVYIQWQRGADGTLATAVVWPTDVRSAALSPRPGAASTGGTTPAGSALIPSLVDGLLLGFVYALAAIGLTLIFGIMRVVNLAHGAVMTMGMFVVLLAVSSLGLNPYLGVALAAVIGLAAGIVIYVIAVNGVVGGPDVMSLLATFAVNLMVIGLATAAFSTSPRAVDVDLGAIRIGGVTILGTHLVAVVLSLVVAAALWAFLYRTRTGKSIRAVASDRAAAELMGIDSRRMLALSFGIGTALAMCAGALLATMFSFTVLAGDSYQTKSFVIVVLGGLGSPLGALVGGMVLGLIEGATSPFVPVSWVPVLEYLLFIAILVVRPTGLFGKRR